MRTGLSIAVASVLLVGCAAVPLRTQSVDRAPLLDGQALFGATVPPAEEVDVLGLSDPMRAFVAANGRDVQVDWLRMRRLVEGMHKSGFLDLNYENDRTFTAAETFDARSGNCLSFTNLFVALARSMKLAAEYQVVDVPPIWDSADGC